MGRQKTLLLVVAPDWVAEVGLGVSGVVRTASLFARFIVPESPPPPVCCCHSRCRQRSVAAVRVGERKEEEVKDGGVI